MSALSYILTSPPRRVCKENLQNETEAYVSTQVYAPGIPRRWAEAGEFKGHEWALLPRKSTGFCLGEANAAVSRCVYDRTPGESNY